MSAPYKVSASLQRKKFRIQFDDVIYKESEESPSYFCEWSINFFKNNKNNTLAQTQDYIPLYAFIAESGNFSAGTLYPKNMPVDRLQHKDIVLVLPRTPDLNLSYGDTAHLHLVRTLKIKGKDQTQQDIIYNDSVLKQIISRKDECILRFENVSKNHKVYVYDYDVNLKWQNINITDFFDK